jgi:hypothetical protein
MQSDQCGDEENAKEEWQQKQTVYDAKTQNRQDF